MALSNKEIEKKLSTVTSALLKEKGYISFVDVFMALGYLSKSDYENWRRKKVPYLERVVTVNLGKINFIMKTVRRNSLKGNLKPSWTAYKSWGKGKKIDGHKTHAYENRNRSQVMLSDFINGECLEKVARCIICYNSNRPNDWF